MKDQIAKIITDYLNKIEVPEEKWDGTVGFFPAEWPLPTCTIADEIAEKLAAAIAPTAISPAMPPCAGSTARASRRALIHQYNQIKLSECLDPSFKSCTLLQTRQRPSHARQRLRLPSKRQGTGTHRV